jgi:hypothetical protein
VQIARRRVLALAVAGLVGAVVAFLAVLYFQVGANKSCLDVRLEGVMPICVAPSTAGWALVAGPLTGGAVAIGVALVLHRRSR